jgi:flagella basal body P-ring formation protein FlgA
MRRIFGSSFIYVLLAPACAAGLAPPAKATEAAPHALADIRAVAERAAAASIELRNGKALATAAALDSRLNFERCGVPLAATAGAIRAAATRISVAVKCAHPRAWTVNVPVEIAVEQSVLVVCAAIARGAPIAAADITSEVRRVPGTATRYLSSPEELAHRVARRSLAPGEVLTIDSLAPAIIVKRGQSVTLVSESNGVTIRANGRAMADAPLHARVRVQNESSSRIVEATVESADTVRVAL